MNNHTALSNIQFASQEIMQLNPYGYFSVPVAKDYSNDDLEYVYQDYQIVNFNQFVSGLQHLDSVVKAMTDEFEAEDLELALGHVIKRGQNIPGANIVK